MLEHLNPTPQKPSRVIVLGAYGFVGGNCARRLGARGVPVLALDKDDIDLTRTTATGPTASAGWRRQGRRSCCSAKARSGAITCWSMTWPKSSAA